jgi:molybdate transport system substrate-binding protein
VTPGRVAVAALLVAMAGCTASGGSPPAPGATGDGTVALSGRVTVLAAASLTESFTEIGRRFRVLHPSVRLTFGFDGSSAVTRQVQAGAPVDVVATADEAAMAPLTDAGLVSAPAVFAHNRLAMLVGRGNTHRLRSLADLARPDLVVVLCAPEVPCGASAAVALDRAGVHVGPRSFEPSVKGVVSSVSAGEADAGIVYVTDVRSAGRRAEGVEIPPEQNVVVAYPVATVRSTGNPRAAAAFAELVRSDDGRRALRDAGFDA